MSGGSGTYWKPHTTIPPTCLLPCEKKQCLVVLQPSKQENCTFVFATQHLCKMNSTLNHFVMVIHCMRHGPLVVGMCERSPTMHLHSLENWD